MNARIVRDCVFWVGAVDWDRRLFDSLIPLPRGTSYNAYLVKGLDKTALIDTVDPAMSETFLSRLQSCGVEHLDYVIVNHAEQDHSGSLPLVLARFPEAQVVTTATGKKLLSALMPVADDRFTLVDDGEVLALGGKVLRFIHTPWVHWPETMVTYLPEDRLLFSCDFFGSHIAAAKLFAGEDATVLEAARAYYAQVMMPFRVAIRKNLEKISACEIDLIAPSHGPLHDHPESIVESCSDWVSDRLSNKVALLYASMHGSTQAMAEHLAEALSDRNIVVEKFNLPVADPAQLAAALVDAATIVIGSPTVLGGAHPVVANAAFLANALRPKARFAAIFGSYAWGGKMVEQLSGMLPNLKVEVLEPVVAKGTPSADDLRALERLAEVIERKHAEAGIVRPLLVSA